MSQLQIDAIGISTILENVASDLKEHCEELGDLDSKIGDGDLGITIGLFCSAISDYLSSINEKDIGKLLVQCGIRINAANPSTFGTILASAFIGGGKAVLGKTNLELYDLVYIGDGAVESIQKRGKAEIGGKTLLDTLVPTVNKFKEEISKGSDLDKAISIAVSAAQEGMKSTINMKAKYGRAACFQDNSIGIQDAGATAFYYLIESFAKYLNSK